MTERVVSYLMGGISILTVKGRLYLAAATLVLTGVAFGTGYALSESQGSSEPVGSCTTVEWHKPDRDGSLHRPFDANRDGKIDCTSDVELGA